MVLNSGEARKFLRVFPPPEQVLPPQIEDKSDYWGNVDAMLILPDLPTTVSTYKTLQSGQLKIYNGSF